MAKEKLVPPRKQIINTIERVGREHGMRRVWEDWIEGMALAWANMLGNAAPSLQDDAWREREARYMQLVQRYGAETWRELARLAQAFPDVLEELETGSPDGAALVRKHAWDGGGDPLGEMYMTLDFGNESLRVGFDGLLKSQNGQVTMFGVVDLSGDRTMYYLVFAVFMLGLLGIYRIIHSPFGQVLRAIRDNEPRAVSLGYAVDRYKLAAFVLSGAIAGLAGFLFAVKDGFVNPEMLSWHLSGAVLIMIILGGLGDLRGAMVGAFAFALLQELFKSEAIFGSYAKHWNMGLGLTIIATVVLLPRGLIGLPELVKERLMGRRNPQEAAREAA